MRGISHLDSQAVWLDNVSGEPLVVLKGCSLSRFRGVDSVMGGPKRTHLFHQLEWKPDISLQSNNIIEQYCINETRTLGGGIENDFERVSRYFMVNTIQQVTPELYESFDECKYHLPKSIVLLLAKRLARSLSVTIKSIDHRRPPSTFGVDSLVAIKLFHWFSTDPQRSPWRRRRSMSLSRDQRMHNDANKRKLV